MAFDFLLVFSVCVSICVAVFSFFFGVVFLSFVVCANDSQGEKQEHNAHTHSLLFVPPSLSVVSSFLSLFRDLLLPPRKCWSPATHHTLPRVGKLGGSVWFTVTDNALIL